MDRDFTRSQDFVFTRSAPANVKAKNVRGLDRPAAKDPSHLHRAPVSASIQSFVINFTLSWTTIFTLPDRVRRIYREFLAYRHYVPAHKRTLPLYVAAVAATSASRRPLVNRLSSVSLENCPPYFYHITSFLSHLPLLPGLVATTTTTTIAIAITILRPLALRSHRGSGSSIFFLLCIVFGVPSPVLSYPRLLIPRPTSTGLMHLAHRSRDARSRVPTAILLRV